MKELIIMCGLNASGKSTTVEEYKAKGFTVMSLDADGGTTNGQNLRLEELLKRGEEKILIDNTNIYVAARSILVKLGQIYKYKVICVHIDTPFEDAQFNAASRMIKRMGRLLSSKEDYKNCKDPNMFPPAALYAARKNFEKPTKAEGFDEIVTVKFKRKPNGYTNKAVIVDYDGTIRKTKSGNIYPTDVTDIEILPGRKEVLQKYIDQGYIILGASNQSGVGKGLLTLEMAQACFDMTNKLLGLKIDVMFCTHTVPPVVCYCRKPAPGMGVGFIEKYKLDPSQCIMVGDMTSDKTFASRCGFKYVPADEFFK